MKKKAVFNWSGGKDSAHALWKILQGNEYEVVSLLTTINEVTELSTMHNLSIELLQAQSARIGIPLEVVRLKPKGSMDDYNQAMRKVVESFRQLGVTHFIFGDIFLHDIRKYREMQLAPYGIELVEPLWGKTSQEVIEDFLATGLKTLVVTTMADGLGEKAIGSLIDEAFVRSLPENCDPNGENGEYHTFCYDGPIYSTPVPFTMGKPYCKSFEIGLEDGSKQTYSYWFAELSLAENI